MTQGAQRIVVLAFDGKGCAISNVCAHRFANVQIATNVAGTYEAKSP